MKIAKHYAKDKLLFPRKYLLFSYYEWYYGPRFENGIEDQPSKVGTIFIVWRKWKLIQCYRNVLREIRFSKKHDNILVFSNTQKTHDGVISGNRNWSPFRGTRIPRSLSGVRLAESRSFRVVVCRSLFAFWSCFLHLVIVLSSNEHILIYLYMKIAKHYAEDKLLFPRKYLLFSY
jgi:hypothetical protein